MQVPASPLEGADQAISQEWMMNACVPNSKTAILHKWDTYHSRAWLQEVEMHLYFI